ncbi:MAG TPA: zf-HC2 domain-containing protein [Anaerolineae bacterium]|nr:zf-HC2 domain-containing protein [Anaerolineae bacterium]HQK15408.1 zf-HC2 domain-containing protein [Anaerolineae bacterium]
MLRDPISDMHSEAWWMRALDGELTCAEERAWQAHLAQCPSCRQEWTALTQVETLLRTATPPPLLPDDFTARTVTVIAQKQKLRAMLRFIVGFVLFALVAWVGLGYCSATLHELVQTVGAVIASRQILFAALMRTLVGLALTVKTFLPLIAGIAVALFLFLMPNSVLATVAMVRLSQKRQARSTAA